MAIEKDLKRVADALERIAELMSAPITINEDKPAGETKKQPAKETKKQPAKEEKTGDADAPELDDVVKALQAYMKKEGREAAVELLGKYEAKRASDIAEEKRAEFIKEAS